MLILGVTLSVAVVTAGYSLIIPPVFTARAMVLPTQDDKGLMGAMMAQFGGGLAGLAGTSLGGPTAADLYVTMLTSETIRDAIIDRFNLLQVYKVEYRLDAYRALDRKAQISIGKKDGVISIAVDDRDAKRAAHMANAYVEELGKMAARLSMTGAGKNRTFLEEKLAAARAELAKAEDALKAFQSKHKAFDVPEQAKASIEGVAQLRGQLATQEVQLAAMQRQFTESSQEVKTAKATVANLRTQIDRLEGNGSGSSILGVDSVPQLGQEYVRLMREFKIQETLVELLTKQYEMAKLTESKDVAPVQIIQKAKVPEFRSKPSRAKMVLRATFSAFFLSLFVSFLLEHFRRKPESERARWLHLVREIPVVGRLAR